MSTKPTPAELGCLNTYTLSYNGRIRFEGNEETQHKNRLQLINYTKRYQECCQELYQLLRELLLDEENHLALYAVLQPAKAPTQISETTWWKENVTGTKNDKGKKECRKWEIGNKCKGQAQTWETISKNKVSNCLKMLAGDKTQKPTRASMTLEQMCLEYGLTCPGLLKNAQRLQDILAKLPSLQQESDVCDAVAAICKSTLSQQERNRQENIQRTQHILELETTHSEFFKALREYVNDTEVWLRSCRTFEQIRETAKTNLTQAGYAESETRAILQATQKAALREAAHTIPHWNGLYAPSDEETNRAQQHPQLVKTFRQACNKPPVMELDEWRRLRSSTSPSTALSKQCYTMERILAMYNNHIAEISEELQKELSARTTIEKNVEHTGWKEMAKRVYGKKATKEEKALHEFIEKKVRTWFRNIRTVKPASWAENPDFWPSIEAGFYGWRTADPTTQPTERQKDNQTWNQACRTFQDIRKETLLTLVSKGHQEAKAKKIINSCQRVALNTSRIAHWQTVRPANNEQEEISREYPELTGRFEAACARPPAPEPPLPRQGQNELQIALKINTDGKKIEIPINLKGNIPASGEKIDPMPVKNGLMNYWPDQQLAHHVRGTTKAERKKTWLKLQAMKIIYNEDRLMGSICSTQITEAIGQILPAKELSQKLKTGERIGVLQLAPGGQVLGNITLFEKSETKLGWKQITLSEIIPDTREWVTPHKGPNQGQKVRNYVSLEKDPITHKTRKRHTFTQRRQTKLGYITLDETSFLRHMLAIEEQRMAKLAAAGNTMQANEELIRQYRKIAANAAKTHYKQVAARVAAICRENNIGHMIIAGSASLHARLTNKEGKIVAVSAPAKQFFSLIQVGTRKNPMGTLMTSLNKSGVNVIITSSRAKDIWMQPYVIHQTLEGCQPGIIYRLGQDKDKNPEEKTTGTKRLIRPANSKKQHTYPYPQNAGWAILLDRMDAKFQEHVNKVRETN